MGFPRGPALIGYDPTPYTDAFRSAATEAVIRDALGRNFYEAFGDTGYQLSQGGGLCTKATLAEFLEQHRSCPILRPVGDPGCLEGNLCIVFQMNSELARAPRILAAAETALRRPCAVLTPPRGLPYAKSPSAIGVPARASWGLLQCGGAVEVVGSEAVKTDNGDTLTLRISFALARIEPANRR